MDDKRNLITAILLSVLILIGWNFIAERFFPAPPTPVEQKAAATKAPSAAPATGELAAPSAAASGTAAAPAVSAQANRSLAAALKDGPRIPIETPKLMGSISLTGARIDDITLTNYRQTVEKNAPPVRLFAPGGTPRAYFASVGWTAQGIAVPDANTLWNANGTKLTPTTPVTLSWTNPTGQTFRIEYAIDKDYLITAKQTVSNAAATPITVASYAFVNRRGKPTHPDDIDSWTIHNGPIGQIGGATNYDWNYDSLDEAAGNRVGFASTGGWIGFTDKYWLAAVIPGQKDKVTAEMKVGAGQLYQTNFARGAITVAAGKAVTETSQIFAGAKEVNVLDDYSERLGITRLDYAIDWGWFAVIAKPIFYLLDWLFKSVLNFGLAIMALTLIIRLLMFPIAQKQFHSMAQMRVVQPKMKELQDKYKDDKPKMQQELMKLYKTEKINPFMGCLPVLLQIPIFYALYKVLMLTIEMRHQPFALWIDDLSVPDPAMVLNLFGLLDFTPPAILGIGVLAILLGVTMWLQFRLNPTPTDPVQQQVFAIMPWMMMFMMAPFAAGLLLYWITNNILTIAQQKWMYSKYPALKNAPVK
ncbi:MAG: membrane protein insertase YidC [Sphingopyxis sp.]|nr:membrane protein insertase YidC [Sphingopyxis sp.]